MKKVANAAIMIGLVLIVAEVIFWKTLLDFAEISGATFVIWFFTIIIPAILLFAGIQWWYYTIERRKFYKAFYEKWGYLPPEK